MMVALEVQAHVSTAMKLKGSLYEAINSLKIAEEEMCVLKDSLVKTFDLYF